MAGHLARILGVLAFVTMAAPAQAQFLGPGWFFEVGVGEANFSGAKRSELDALTGAFFDSFNLTVDSLDSTLSRKDRSYAINSGYRFNDYLQMETTYYRLGAFQYAAAGSVSDQGGSYPATMNFSFRAKGVMFGVAGTYPFADRFELRGRVGLSTTSTRLRYAAALSGQGSVADKVTASSQDFYFGAGVGMYLWDYYRVGIDFTHHRDVGKSELTYSSDVNNLMLTLGYRY